MKSYLFGRTKAGEPVTAYCLTNACGAKATILDYGCTVQALSVPNAQGGFTDVVLGYDTIKEYEENGGYIGAAIGRVANRIGGSTFNLNGKTYNLAENDGKNHLHGGVKGFDKFIWHVSENGGSLVFTRLSPDGEENYPGNLTVQITYTLTDRNELHIIYDADTDADTVINLTNHSYFNLNGNGTALNHYLQVFADQFTENDEHCLPTGKFLSTAGTPFDFRKLKPLGQEIDSGHIQLLYGNGYDHNFVLSDIEKLKKAAILIGPETGIKMSTFTTMPGLQVYSGNSLTPLKGKNGSLIDRRCAVCLETQIYPNAMACPDFPSPILRKNEHYHTETVYCFEIIRENV